MTRGRIAILYVALVLACTHSECQDLQTTGEQLLPEATAPCGNAYRCSYAAAAQCATHTGCVECCLHTLHALSVRGCFRTAWLIDFVTL